VPALNELATTAYDDTATYGDKVHIVNLYVIEPHPMDPDPSPYTGEVWEAQYSTKLQAMTYDERVAAALDTEQLLEGNQIMLVDDLTPGGQNNPIWCTYGTCPNCAYLIRQDGVIDTVQTWVNVNQMKAAIDLILE
jgi:hypothetical protein